MTRKTDTAPTPAITFATPEAGNRVVADLRAKYEEAARYAVWGVLSLAEIPFRVLRAAALAVCPPDTHDVFESEEVCDD